MTGAVAAGVAGLVLVLVGCQGGDGEAAPRKESAPRKEAAAVVSASPAVCADGVVRWSEVRQKPRLVAFSEPVEDTPERKGTFVAYAFTPVEDVRSAVTVDAPVDTERLLTSLEERLRTGGNALARPGAKVGLPGDEQDSGGSKFTVEFTGSGKEFASGVGVTAVEAGFTYECDGAAPVRGTVATWHKRSTVLLECGVVPPASRAHATAAYRMACGGRAAARG